MNFSWLRNGSGLVLSRFDWRLAVMMVSENVLLASQMYLYELGLLSGT